MKKTMNVSRETLVRSIQAVSPGLSPKEIIEQSSCIVIQDGMILTFNDEITCRCESPFPKKFEAAIPATKLSRLLEKISADDIDVSLSDNKITFTAKREKFWIPISTEVLLPASRVKLPKKWHKLPSEFIDAVTIVQECASKADEKTGRTAVHIHPKWVEAWDGFQMARFRIKLKRLESPVLIRKPTIAHVVNMGVTHYGETSNWFHFKNSQDQIISCRKLTDDFEDISKHYKVEGKTISLPKGLAEAADKARIFSEDDKDRDLAIVTVKDGRIYVEASSDNGGYSSRSKVKFKGSNLSFTIPPIILKELINRHNECILNPTRLKVDGGRWSYVTALGDPDALNTSSDQSEETTEESSDESNGE